MTLQSFARTIVLAALMVSASPVWARDAQPGLYIRAGEAFIFRVENGQPVDARRATAGEAPQSGEIKAEMSAEGGTMLMVTNLSGQSLNYEAFIARDEYARGSRTSVCTLAAPMTMESWPDSLPGIRITNFQPAGDGMVCR